MRHVLNMIVSLGFLLGCYTNAGAEIASKVHGLERITQQLVAPPFLPAHSCAMPVIASARAVTVTTRASVVHKFMGGSFL